MPSKTLRVAAILLVTALAADIGLGQTQAIHQQIQQIYNFQPHLLQDRELTAKSAVLDQFWAKAKSDRADYIPALRQELADFRNPSFFLYDGSMLLLSMSDTPGDRKIALAAIARCDLRDVQTKDYFYQVHRLASVNEDTTAAAFHVLEEPKYQVFIPQHVLTLGQNYVLIYLLLPTDQHYWEQPAIDRLNIERDQTAQQSLLLLLWYAQSNAADQAIASFAKDVSKSAASRAYAKELLTREEKIGLSVRTRALASSEQSLRQKRRERLKAVSDEALIDLDDYTQLLIAKRK
jgi:hypothetical protein